MKHSKSRKNKLQIENFLVIHELPKKEVPFLQHAAHTNLSSIFGLPTHAWWNHHPQASQDICSAKTF